MLRCVVCKTPWRTTPARACPTACPGCGAKVDVDAVAIDVLPGRAPPASLRDRAMLSGWMARVYETAWRPWLFPLSRAAEERLVLDRLRGCGGPWLDLSCGPGTFGRASVSRPEIVAVDLSRPMLERLARRDPGTLRVRADAAALPFEDEVFGAVVNLAALDLYPEPALVVAEATRVLAPGGRLLLSSFVADRAGQRAPLATAVLGALDPERLEVAGSLRFGHYLLVWADRRPPAKG